MSEQDLTIRKLAVLVDALDTGTANRFLESVSGEEATRIRRYVLELGRVSHDERENILRQFLFAIHGAQDEDHVDEQLLEKSIETAVNDRVRAVSPDQLTGLPAKSLLNLQSGGELQ